MSLKYLTDKHGVQELVMFTAPMTAQSITITQRLSAHKNSMFSMAHQALYYNALHAISTRLGIYALGYS